MTTGITATTATSRRGSCGHYRILIRPGRQPSRLFPVSQAFQLFRDFHQSLKPPCIVGYSRAIFRVERIFAVLFGEFSYFPSQLFDTLCDESRHDNLPLRWLLHPYPGRQCTPIRRLFPSAIEHTGRGLVSNSFVVLFQQQNNTITTANSLDYDRGSPRLGIIVTYPFAQVFGEFSRLPLHPQASVCPIQLGAPL